MVLKMNEIIPIYTKERWFEISETELKEREERIKSEERKRIFEEIEKKGKKWCDKKHPDYDWWIDFGSEKWEELKKEFGVKNGNE